MKAPEKIYLEPIYPDNGVLPNGLNYTPSPTDIEYTRTDGFIEKATEWLCNNYDKYIRVIGSSIYPAYSDMCRDFQTI